MGLKATGENGAKAQLRDKCKRAFRTCNRLLDCRNEANGMRVQTSVIVDMNVILMSVPMSVTTLVGFVKVVWSFVEDAIGTGWLTFLVFDEPAHMTNAKRLEQARRDAQKQAKTVVCSNDIDPFPFTDDYTKDDLEQCENVLAVRDKRSCRSRMYDEVAKRVFEIACKKADKYNASGKAEHRTAIVMDGVDIRGCDRPSFSHRNPGMVSNDEHIAAAFARDRPIGEGDLKLQAIENRIRELALPGELLAGTNLVMSSTIDTDSLMIASLAVSKRRVHRFGASVHALLCMRTPGKRNGGEDDGRTESSYLVVDVAMLEALILEFIYGRGTTVPPATALNTMLALAAGAALSGCDFCSLSGARFDHFFNTIGEFAKTEPLALKSFSNCLSDNPETAKLACQGLLRVCYNASAKMEEKGKRYQRQAKDVEEVDGDTLRRAIWTASYWSLNEFEANDGFGFPTPKPSGSNSPTTTTTVVYSDMMED